MGKIRVKTFGSPEQEEQENKKNKEKRQAKKKLPAGRKAVKAPGLKGGADERSEGARLLDRRGQRIVAVGPSQEEFEKIAEQTQEENKTSEEKPSSAKTPKGKKEKFVKVKVRSKKYQASAQVLDKTKVYSMAEALELLAKFQKAKFDETVELHLNTTRTGIFGSLTLPHGIGKITKVAIATDELIEEIEKGKIDFDILLAKPDIMPKLARVAKILGPKGLMPNPKNGTVTQNPQEAIKKYEAGQISFKTEAKAPLIHLSVGKFSFGNKKLADNINSILKAVKPENIQKAVLKTTMSPAVKLKL